MTQRPTPPMYFSLRTVQPFAKMELRAVEGEPGVDLTIADGTVVGLLLPDVRRVPRVPRAQDQIRHPGLHPGQPETRNRAVRNRPKPGCGFRNVL